MASEQVGQLLYDEYAALTQKYKAEYGPDTLVLMEVGSFMEWYDCDRRLGADVPRICALLNVQPTRKNKAVAQVSRQNPAYSGFPRVAMSKYVPVLVESGMTVALAMQVSPPPNPRRRVVEVLSRATLTGSSLLDIKPDVSDDVAASPCMMAVYIERGRGWTVAGWAVVDVATGRTTASEVSTGGPQLDAGRPMDVLRRVCASYGPSEIVVSRTGDGVPGLEELRASLGTCMGVAGIVERNPEVCSGIALQNAVLSRSFPSTGFLSPAEYVGLERMPCALSALVLALQFLHEHGGLLTTASGVRLQQPEVVLEDSHIHASADAFRQLDVQPMLLKLLNRCTTPAGRRAFRDRLLNPVCSAEKIRLAHDAVDAELDGDRHEGTRGSLAGVGDIERHFRRACVGRASACDLLALAASARSAASAIRRGSSQDGDRVAAMADEISALVTSHVEADSAIERGRTVLIRGAFADVDAADDELASARQVFYQAAAALNSAIGADQVRVLEGPDADGGMALGVTARRWASAVASGAAAKASVEPWFCGSDATLSAGSQAGSPRLVHPALGAAASERVRTASARLAAVVAARLAELQAQLASSHTDSMWEVVRAVEAIDIAATCARNARDYGLVRPSVTDAGGRARFNARGLRHPIIENIRGRREAYVPNDVALEDGGMRGMLLYGVNAVGKSSVMKAVGLAVVMAQAGMFVAADSLQISPFSDILTRIGLRDDIAAGHSTFMVEMLELRAILLRAGPRSLVLGDELCAGTESASALAIVGAGVMQLSSSGCAFVLATHLHELAEIPQVRAIEGVRAMHLSVRHDAATGRLEMGRKLQAGPGLQTYGLEVCRSLDMGDAFLASADTIRRQVLGPGAQQPIRHSRYNASVIVDRCLVCGAAAEETHHIVPQATAGTHVKNRAHNLAPLCSGCHDAVHSGRLAIEGFRMTGDGVRLVSSSTPVPPHPLLGED